jgi:hypothetical protein
MAKLIEEKISELYCIQGDTWIVEKGKVKEGRLLKEAHDEIVSLRRRLSRAEHERNYEYRKRIELVGTSNRSAEHSIKVLSNAVSALEEIRQTSLSSFLDEVALLSAEIEDLKESLKTY